MRYIYTCKCGNETIKILPVSKFKQSIKCSECKGRMFINVVKQQKSVKDISCWPMESDALGVHPAQAKEYAEYLRSRGVPTEVNSEGNPILVSREHRRQVCDATGMYDRNAGYGDKAPDHVHVSRQELIKQRENKRKMIQAMIGI